MFSNTLVQLNRDYYCDFCDKTIKLKSNKNHLKSLPHIQYEQNFRISHTITNPHFFDVVKTFNFYMANHKKFLFLSFQM